MNDTYCTRGEKLIASAIWIGLTVATIGSLFVVPWDAGAGLVNHIRMGAIATAVIAALMRFGMNQPRPGIVVWTEDELPRNDGRWKCVAGPDLNRPAGSFGQLANEIFFE